MSLANASAHATEQDALHALIDAKSLAYTHFDDAGRRIRHQQYLLASVLVVPMAVCVDLTVPVFVPQCDVPISLAVPLVPRHTTE